MDPSELKTVWRNWVKEEIGGSDLTIDAATQAAVAKLAQGGRIDEAADAAHQAAEEWNATVERRGQLPWNREGQLDPRFFPPPAKHNREDIKRIEESSPARVVGGFLLDTVTGLMGENVASAPSSEAVARRDRLEHPGVSEGEQALNIAMAMLPVEKLLGRAFNGAKSLLTKEAEGAATAAEKAFLTELDESFKSVTANAGKPVAQNLARGNFGEKLAADTLASEGHRILYYKPSVLETSKRGIDLVTLKDNFVYFVDNKALTREGNVSSVSALTRNFEVNKGEVVNELRAHLNQNISAEERALVERALEAIREGRYQKWVTNANFTDNTRILTGVTGALDEQGIKFKNVMPEAGRFRVSSDAVEASTKYPLAQEVAKDLDSPKYRIAEEVAKEADSPRYRIAQEEELAVEGGHESSRASTEPTGDQRAKPSGWRTLFGGLFHRQDPAGRQDSVKASFGPARFGQQAAQQGALQAARFGQQAAQQGALQAARFGQQAAQQGALQAARFGQQAIQHGPLQAARFGQQAIQQAARSQQLELQAARLGPQGVQWAQESLQQQVAAQQAAAQARQAAVQQFASRQASWAQAARAAQQPVTTINVAGGIRSDAGFAANLNNALAHGRPISPASQMWLNTHMPFVPR